MIIDLFNREIIGLSLGWHKTADLVKEAIQSIPYVLTKVGLEPDQYQNRLPKDLSGGERQRIGILRAIIAHPKVLLMDEPFSALDPISRSQLQDLIKALHQEFGMTTVFVTHDMDEAVKLADRICLMRAGEVVQLGTPDELRNQSADGFVTEFMNNRGGAK